MGTKVELLLNLLNAVRETLLSIQKERFKLNEDEVPIQTKKKITNEKFQKLISLKNDDYSTILNIRNEILALAEDDADFRAYQNDAIEDKITAISKCFDLTFSIVDQMKRETEFLENTSTEFEDESFSLDADKSIDFCKSKDGTNSYGDSNSNSDVMIQGRETLCRPRKEKLSSKEKVTISTGFLFNICVSFLPSFSFERQHSY